MVSNAFVLRMPAGIPGAVTRNEQSTIEAVNLDTTDYPTVYGVPLVIDATSRNARKVKAGDTPAVINGMYVRPYVTSGNGTDGLGTSTPPVSGIGNSLRRGYMTVKLNAGVAAKGNPVFVRVGNAGVGTPIGGIEAASESTVTAAATVGTGTQTAGTLSATKDTPAGVYTVKMTSGSLFDVKNAAGAPLLTGGGFATTYTLDNGLTFRMTTGGVPTAGDTTAITVVQNTIVLPTDTTFEGAADTDGNVEIAFNI